MNLTAVKFVLGKFVSMEAVNQQQNHLIFGLFFSSEKKIKNFPKIFGRLIELVLPLHSLLTRGLKST